jgi:tRNA-binding EMAP/Myf-like protein
LKPAKLAGQASEAMVLAAEANDSSGQLIVRTLLPPGGLPYTVPLIHGLDIAALDNALDSWIA